MSEWMDNAKAGDVVASQSGSLRVIRHVKQKKGMNYYFTFAIKRCSWTGRADTVYTRSDVRTLFTPTGKRVRLTHREDFEFNRYLSADFYSDRTKRMDCCHGCALP